MLRNINDNETAGIIGFGLSGLTTFCSYIDDAIEHKKTPNIIIFEKNKENFATGIAFNRSAPKEWLINGPPADRFKVPENGTTLEQWISEHPGECKKYGDFNHLFPPRALT